MSPSPWWRDALERVGWTFVEAAAGTVVLAEVLDLATLEAAGLAGVIAALAAVKVIAASKIGKSNAAIGA